MLAEAVGMNRVFYVGVEGARRNGSLNKVFALADALVVGRRGGFFVEVDTFHSDQEPPAR
ncbi:hypothetical protein [Streptomyces europaeiscabiei]|uniref:hypothetical protein n=1 Tax=Streptomyces europaeiscabiei TaxID=146819 RepID=UPI0029A0E3D4|nr:hypothetical protein [Streptomyces europaeiscabiei]MDX3866841.1 hypothetical protein [Streptomyces europaeiscabiei]MDX3873130.1 hypothetical protein [Streptomyces europaeiscabiei]